jgi:acyl-CoA oxidase
MSSENDPLAAVRRDRPLLPFLPLIYVAWADGELTVEEAAGIGALIEEQELGDDCRRRLSRWLDPTRPPAAAELQAILRTVRRAGRGLPDPARDSLASLGGALVAATGGTEITGAERRALAALEGALGVAGGEVSRALLTETRPAAAEAAPAPRFAPARLRRLLDAPHGALRDRVRAILSQPEFSYRYDLDRDVYRDQVLAWCRRLADEGLGALALPREFGGEDDLGRFIAVFETLAFFDQSLLVKFGVQFGLFGGSILQLGTRRHHERYLAAAGRLELPGCFAMSETGHGSNVADLATVARYDNAAEEFEIDTPTPPDRKDWIGNAARHGRLATVFAQLEIGGERFGVHAFLVPIRGDDGEPLPGVEIEDCGLKEGLNGVDNGRLSFRRVRIPRTSLLDRFATVAADGTYDSPIASPDRRFFTMLGTLVGGRISVAAAALSAARSGLAVAIRYGERRRQFGPVGAAEVALMDYRTHQRRLLPRLADTYAVGFAHRYLVDRFLARGPDDVREVEGLAAGLKVYSSWQTVATLQACREACGGQGYLRVNRIAELMDDTDVYTTFEGDNTVLLQLVAKGLLTRYRHQFTDLRLGGLVRYLAGRASQALVEVNPVFPRRTDEDHLRNPEFHLHALRYREDRLLTTAARRLKERIDRGLDSFEALNQCQDHLLSLALAYVERVILERFQTVLDEVDDETLQPVLGRLYDLWALWRIEQDRGWFLENGYLEGGKAKAIRTLVNRLLAEVRPDAPGLVEAFGIPDSCLAAPIAFSQAPESVRTSG